MNVNDVLHVPTVRFVPFRQDNILPVFDASFRVMDPGLRISVASAFYPTVAGICQNIFDQSAFTERASLDKTYNSKGISDLVEGKIDIFVTYSSKDDQEAMRKALGKFECVPLFQESLAVLVNKENPVRDITYSQLKGIYEGKYVNWIDVGGFDKVIRTFQLGEGNVSRLGFLDGIKSGTPINLPQSEIETMPELVDTVADDECAIGNIFWPYYARMYANKQTRYLKIDGNAPSSSEYPIKFPICLHYDGTNPKGQLHEMVEYLRTDEGRRLTELAHQSERVVE